MENEEDSYVITIKSSPTHLSLWKTLRSQFGQTELEKHPVVQSIAQERPRVSKRTRTIMVNLEKW